MPLTNSRYSVGVSTGIGIIPVIAPRPDVGAHRKTIKCWKERSLASRIFYVIFLLHQLPGKVDRRRWHCQQIENRDNIESASSNKIKNQFQAMKAINIARASPSRMSSILPERQTTLVAIVFVYLSCGTHIYVRLSILRL